MKKNDTPTPSCYELATKHPCVLTEKEIATENSVSTLKEYTGLIIDIFKIIFISLTTTGYIIFWIYLSSYKLAYIYSSVITSGYILLIISILSLLMSLFLSIGMALSPYLYKNHKEHIKNKSGIKQTERNEFMLDAVIFFLNLTVTMLYFIVAPKNASTITPFYIYLTTIIVTSFLAVYFYGYSKNEHKLNIFDIIVIIQSQLLLIMPIILFVYIAIKTEEKNNFIFALISYVLSSIFYSLLASSIINKVKYKYTIITICQFVLLLIFATYSVNNTNTIIKYSGLGQYNITLLIDKKAKRLLHINNKTDDNDIQENFFVIANLNEILLLMKKPTTSIPSLGNVPPEVFILPKQLILGMRTIGPTTEENSSQQTN